MLSLYFLASCRTDRVVVAAGREDLAAMAAFQVAGLTRTTAAIQAVVGAFLAVAHRVIGDENTQKNHSASQNVAAPH